MKHSSLIGPGIKRAFIASIPILISYLMFGFAFGLFFNTLGYHWIYAALSGIIVFAGAAQFFSVGLLSAHAGPAQIFFAILSLNLRHMFYGFSLFHRFSEHPWLRPYLIFGLTDETYSVLTSSKLHDKSEDERFCFFVTLFNHLYWVCGCALGAIAGQQLHFNMKGLEFVMPALFTVLVIEQALVVRELFPFAIACAAAVLAMMTRSSQMLMISMSVVFFFLVAKSASRDIKHE